MKFQSFGLNSNHESLTKIPPKEEPPIVTHNVYLLNTKKLEYAGFRPKLFCER